MGNHRHAGLGRLAGVGQQLGHLQQFVIVLHPRNAVLGKHLVVQRIRAGQGRRVGAGRPRTQVGTPNLDKDNGLAPFRRQPGHLNQFARVLETLHEAGNHPHRILVQQVAGKVAEVQVGLVAGGNDVAQPDAFLHRPGQEGPKGRRPALAHQANRPAQPVGTPRRSRRPDVRLHVGYSQAVRPADTQPRLPRKGAHFPLQVPPVVQIPLRKAGGYDDSRFGPLGVAFLQHVQHLVVRHHDAHQVRRLRQVADAGVGRQPHNFIVTGVHRVDVHPLPSLQHRVQEAAPVLHSRRRPHHGHGAGVEHLVNGSQLRFGPNLGSGNHRLPRFRESIVFGSLWLM